MRENKWRVIRHGMDADVVMNAKGDNQSIRADILGWIERIEPYAMKLGIRRPYGCAACHLRQGQQLSPPAIRICQEPVLARGYRIQHAGVQGPPVLVGVAQPFSAQSRC